jgi:hypothetical protein
MRPRFRLRTLLILTALVAAGCYWWIARPTIVAERFKFALEHGDFATASDLWIDDGRTYIDFDADMDNPHFPVKRWNIEVQPRTWSDVRQGMRRVRVVLTESARDSADSMTSEFPPIIATSRGVFVDPVSMTGGGFF